jgi:hypothetical protein
MRKPYFVFVLGSFLVAGVAVAQVTVGVMPATLNSSDANFPTPQTDVSLENPATGSGNITSVSFGWNAACTGVAKIKFFRRSGNTLTMFAERGPFDTSAGRPVHFAVLSPGVGVQAGDLIAITRVVAGCGNTLAEAGTGTQGYVVLQGDATSGTISAGNTFHDKLGLVGTGSAPGDVAAGFLPVVGSTAGGFGSNFKTSVQMINPSTTVTMSGRLIFHRAGTSGTLTDPSSTFSVSPGEVIVYPDVVAGMGQTGLGSIDIVSSAGAQIPITLTRIYNDAGTSGTAGFFEEVVSADVTGTGSHILTAGTQGFLVTPIEPARTRLNIGVRSLASGVTLVARLETSTGQVIAGGQERTYQPNWFEQVSAEVFFNTTIGANQKVRITVTAGNAIVYGATTDNVTNDPSVQFATAVPVP